ncbi:MAG: hypothetical protein WCK47_10825 [bacterium]
MPLLSVSFRETITVSAEARGKHIRQLAGGGRYGDTLLTVEPLARGTGVEFANALDPGRIPAPFIADIAQGVIETIEEGVLAGFPLVDLRVTLRDGSYHHLHSTPLSFRVAASIALHDAVVKASPIILTPVVKLEFTAAMGTQASLLRDIHRMNGIVLYSAESEPGRIRIEATLPLDALLEARALEDAAGASASFAPSAPCVFDWRGNFRMQFSHYERAPAALQERLIREAARQQTSGGATPSGKKEMS